MSTGYDTYNYTPGESIGAGADDDWTITPIAAPTKSADEIAGENSFRDVPPGDHTLVVVKVEKGEEKRLNVAVGAKPSNGKWEGGTRHGYTGQQVRVRFALEDDRGCQIGDMFMFCADADPMSVTAYYEGVEPGGDANKRGGFHANKFFHFLGMLGYECPRGGSIPAEALNPRNWVGRRIAATVQEPKQKTYVGRDGQERVAFNQVKMFSYRKALGQPTTKAPAAQGGGHPAAHAPAPAPTTTAPQARPNQAKRDSLNAV